MVHRKSTYRLAFKNINTLTRKSIWEENIVMRLKHHKTEMAHHSIDESDFECECDTQQEIDENDLAYPEEIERSHYKSYPQKKSILKSSKDLLKNHDSDTATTATDKTKKKICRPSSLDKFTTSITDEEHVHRVSPHSEARDGDAEELSKSPLNYKFSLSLQGTAKEQSPTNTDEDKEDRNHNLTTGPRPMTDHSSRCNSAGLRKEMKQERRYLSESNVNQRKEDMSTSRGVMKFSPLTGEFDLIPSRLCKVKQRTTIDRPWQRIFPGAKDPTKFINIRPRSSLSSTGLSPPSEGPASRHLPRRELASSRRQPRLGDLERATAARRHSVCPRCGQKVRSRGVMT